jgi:penicillin-binding protein 1B
MKRAIQLPAYRNVQPFTPPDGVVNLNLDKVTNRIATATCPDDYTAAFIVGTEPKETCDQTASDQRGFFSKLFGLGPKPLPPAPVSNVINQPGQQPGQNGQAAPGEDPGKKKKGFFGKIFGAFKDDKDKDKDPGKQNPPPAATPH